MDIVFGHKDIRVIGKNKNFRSHTARFFAGLLLLQIFITVFSLALPQSAAAAATGGAISSEGNFTCRPVIAGPNDDYLNGAWQNYLTTVGFPSDEKIADTFADIYEKKNKVFIYFTGENSNNDGQCQNTMLLVQSSDPDEKGQFYGAWYGSEDPDSIASQPLFQSAYVNPETKTIKFTITGLNRTPRYFDLNVTPADSTIWTNPSHFPQSGGSGSTGGGNTSTGQCNLEVVEASSPCVSALPAHFTDAATITMDGEIYKATYWGGDSMKYLLTSSPNQNRKASNTSGSENCTPYFELDTADIDINIDDDNAGSTAEALQNIANIPGNVTLKYVNKSTGCGEQGETDKTVSTLGFKRIAKLYPGENSIRLVFPDGRNNERKFIGNYQKVDDTHYALTDNPIPGCEARPPQFVLSNKHTGGAGSTVTATWQVTDSACNYIDAANIRVVLESADANSSDDGFFDVGEEGTIEDNEPTCENSGALSWILCPVLGILDAAIFWLDNEITNMLTIREEDFTRDDLQNAWARLRNIALLILVPMMLVMVISTALGFSMIDAYTVKKALPRLVAATLFISLSWTIVTFMIEFTNNVGQGVQGLIMSSFTGDTHITIRQLFETEEGFFLLLVTGGGGVAAVFAGALSWGILGSYALAAFLALLIAFLVLTLRQMLVLAFMLLAPLAILAWIFPGNDKLWKLWWSSFSKLLLMFPLIMALLASGKVFAYIIKTSASGGWEDPVTILMMLAAYIGPYFFIPATFKFAGGVFGTLAGMANDRERGMFDRLRKGREEQRKELHERAGANRRFNPQGRLGRFNNMAGWAADPLNNARVAKGQGKRFWRHMPVSAEQGRGIMSELTAQSATQSQELAKWMSQVGFNQEALTAIIGATDRKTGRIDEGQLHSYINRYRNSTDTQERAAASQLSNYSGFLVDAWRSEEYGRANMAMAAGLGKAAQGFLGIRDVGENARIANMLNEAAPGLGDTFKTQAGLFNKEGFSKVGYSEQARINPVTGQVEYVAGGKAARAIQAMRTGVQDFAAGKASQFKQAFVNTGAIQEIFSTPHNEEIVDDVTGEHMQVTNDKKLALFDNLAQAAYGYNTPAETAAVLREQLTKIKQQVADTGDMDLLEKINRSEIRSQRMGIDEAARGTTAPGGEDAAGGGPLA